jgi:hypothetical protein
MPNLIARASWSIQRALSPVAAKPAVRQVAFTLSSDERQLHIWSTLDSDIDDEQLEDLRSDLADVYADFSWPEKGDPEVVEHEERVNRAMVLVARGHIVYQRVEPPLLRADLDANGDPIGFVAVIGDDLVVPLTRKATVFGRVAGYCDVCIPNDSKVSRNHFAVLFTVDAVAVTDTHSACGTILDNALVPSNGQWLRDGSVIVAGESVVRIRKAT